MRDLGLERVQVVVRWEMEEETRAMVAIEENIRRRQLQPSEMARAIKKLIELKGKRHKAEEVAQEVGLSRRQVERYQGLSQLIPEISALLDGGKLTQAVALQIAQMDEAVQRLFYEALGDRIAQVVSEQKASEFKETHAGLLNQVQDLSAMTKKLEQRKQEFEARLKELREHLDQAEFKVGDEIKAKRLLEEELEKTRAEMYQKVQEKQALIDKLKSIEPSVVPPPDYHELKAENARLKKTIKETGPSAAKSAPPSEVLAAELHTLVTGRLLTLDIQPFRGNLSPQAREQLRGIIRSLEAWLANLKQIVQVSGKAEKGRTGGS